MSLVLKLVHLRAHLGPKCKNKFNFFLARSWEPLTRPERPEMIPTCLCDYNKHCRPSPDRSRGACVATWHPEAITELEGPRARRGHPGRHNPPSQPENGRIFGKSSLGSNFCKASPIQCMPRRLRTARKRTSRNTPSLRGTSRSNINSGGKRTRITDFRVQADDFLKEAMLLTG